MGELDQAKLDRVLRRYLAPELASKVVREVVEEPEAPALPPPTALEIERVTRIARAKGLIVVEKPRRKR